MNHFEYRNGVLHAEDVSLLDIAAEDLLRLLLVPRALQLDDPRGRLIDRPEQLRQLARRFDVGELALHLVEVAERRQLLARRSRKPVERALHRLPRGEERVHVLRSEPHHLAHLVGVVVGSAVEIGDGLEATMNPVDALGERAGRMQPDHHDADHRCDEGERHGLEQDDTPTNSHARLIVEIALRRQWSWERRQCSDGRAANPPSKHPGFLSDF